ncbi:circularly permuted type 2 ATP-grasp protein [Modestobacter sp. SYSU DS0511]
MSETAGVFARYPGSTTDEAVDASGRMRADWSPVARVLDELGGEGLAATALAVGREREMRGVVLGSWLDGRFTERPLPLCPVPRLLPAADWAHLARGVEQRARALNAYLADVYRPAGRRRSDPDGGPEVVRAGVVPARLVSASPGHRPEAVELGTPTRARATVVACDLVQGPHGWVVLADELRMPVGLGYALANRDSGRAALPGLYADAEARGLADPAGAVAVLRAALAEAAPPACSGTPRLAVLSDGPGSTSWFEHRLLAEAMGVPLATPDTLWATPAGGVAVQVRGERVPVDVLYRRVDESELAGRLTVGGPPLGVLTGQAVRAGRLTLANVPGNGVADDPALHRYVPELIRFYLAEEPVLPGVPSWSLAEDAHLAEVRDRLHELVVVPVDGYAGQGAVHGPRCSAAELAELHAEVEAAPHRFVVREPVEPSTVPTVVDGVVRPRRAGLRVFAVAGSSTRVLPAPLTRVAADEDALLADEDAGSKDTWLLPR